MIKPTKGPRGQEQARCQCDACGAEAIVPAAHGNAGDFKRGGRRAETLRNEAQVTTKLHGLGWSFIRNVHRCPDCESARRNASATPKPTLTLVAKETPMLPIQGITGAAAEAPRQMTPKQKREIISVLEMAYDDESRRYKGKDTDLTVAQLLGAAFLPGWVTQVREELFGPEGANDEMEELRAELVKLKAEVATSTKNATVHLREAEGYLRKLNEAEKAIADLTKRVEAVKAAVGPKARSA